MLVLQERLAKAEKELERMRGVAQDNANKLQEAETNLITKEFEAQKLQTLIERERGMNQYTQFQLREREGLIEANNLLQKERNELAAKLNGHRQDIESAQAEANKAK